MNPSLYLNPPAEKIQFSSSPKPSLYRNCFHHAQCLRRKSQQSSSNAARIGRGTYTSPPSAVPVVHPSVETPVAGSALMEALVIKVEQKHTLGSTPEMLREE
uniref:Uncharacterized protein n=1 Tax=Medicago truncatula TaxID=3880 RepID=Q2HSU2_MEDTR|nr:hypothetical protein MtrDRAFT_AC150891g34v2 [Medicago truncatula]